MTQSIHLEQAIQTLKRDPTQPVRVEVDQDLTVEVRVVQSARPRRSAAAAFRQIGRWEGETGDGLDALFARQRSNRTVTDLT